jgi:AraC-like DNA-binding protein
VNFSTHATIDVVGRAAREVELLPPQAKTEDVFHATGTQWQFGEILVGDFRLEAFGDDRHPQGPPRYPTEQAVNVVFICEGTAHVSLAGSTFVFVAGSGVVLPTNELPAFYCTVPTRILAVSLRGPDAFVLSGLIPEQPTAIAAAVIGTHPALEFLLALVATAQKHPIKTPPAGAIIAKLVASMLGADLDWHTRPNDPAVTEVLTLIDERFKDPAFDVKAIARHLHITTRDLELLFDRQYGGRRPSDVLLERKLVAAMTLLHPDSACSAEQIAARSGFATVAALDEAIDSVYGLDTKTLLAIQSPA